MGAHSHAGPGHLRGAGAGGPRWNWLANTPRAHITNQRAMEVLRDLGVEEEAKSFAMPWDLIGDATFATSFAGPEIARLQMWGTGDDRHSDYLRGSPCPLVDLIQPLAERVLVTNAAARGAKVPVQHRVRRAQQDDDGVTVTLKDRVERATLHPAGSIPGRRRWCPLADRRRDRPGDRRAPCAGGPDLCPVQRRSHPRTPRTGRAACTTSCIRPRASERSEWARCARCGRGISGWPGGASTSPKASRTSTTAEPWRRSGRWSVTPDLEAEIEWVSPWYVNQARATTYSRGGCSAAEMLSIGTHRRAGWGPTPACRTRSTSPGSSPSWSRATPEPSYWTPTRSSGHRSARRSSPGPTSPASTTPRCGRPSPPPTPATHRRRVGEDPGQDPGGRQGQGRVARSAQAEELRVQRPGR